MARPTKRLLIVGIGGSGRTHHLRAWADDQQRQVDGSVVWVRGAFDHRHRANAAKRLLDSLGSVTDADALVVDDAHWLADDVVERIIELVGSVPTAVARAPWPDSAALRELDAALTTQDPAHRLEPLDDHALSDMLGELATDELDHDTLLASTGGLPGLIALLVDADFEPTDITDNAPPAQVVDVIVRRARASGSDVLDAARIMTHGVDATVASELIADESVDGHTAVPHGDVERRLRASGLLADEHLLPVAAQAISADMTAIDRRRSIAQASRARDVLDPEARSRLLLLAADAEPVERARAAIYLGDPRADALVAALDDVRDPAAAQLAFVLDMRAMRWRRASERTIDHTSTGDARHLAGAFDGLSAPTRPADTVAPNVPAQILDDLHRLIAAFTRGSTSSVVELATHLIDDTERARIDGDIGWTPAAIASSLLMQSGRHESARTALRAAIADRLGGPGEQASHHLLAAFGDIATGEYSAALDLVRAGPADGWPHRDRFLLAALDAAIARRSGDTTRLRDAWRRAAPLVERQSLTWLLLDPTIEILAAGRRVGDDLIVNAALERLSGQLEAWPPDGPAPAMLAWAHLQVAVAGEDWHGVRNAARHLAATSTTDDRSAARRMAAAVWEAIAHRIDTGSGGDNGDLDTDLDPVISALVDVGDAWEASRLLGQLALDHPDPAAARSLLERARLLVSDPVEAADGLIAAGLSEREAEVARLVAQGRAYKEIGGQLFISAKTVEHHVARIKQRLGAGNRAEMLSLIRELSGDP